MGSSGRDPIGGPYEPRISPDGRRFAYYFYVQTSFDDYENDIRWIDTGSYGTWTWADHFTSPATESESERSFTQPEWVTNDRLLGTQGMYLNMWTWKLGTGHGYTYAAAQWWFGLHDPLDEWGVAAYHWYDDPALSRDGSKLAMTDCGRNSSVIAATHGPAWSGEPPYAEVDYVNPESELAAPTIACRDPAREDRNPSWSTRQRHARLRRRRRRAPDQRATARGDRLLVPGAVDPAFGPADVNMAQAPKSPGAAGSGPRPRPRRSPSCRSNRAPSGPAAAAPRSATSCRPPAASRSRSPPPRASASRAWPITKGKTGVNTLRFKRAHRLEEAQARRLPAHPHTGRRPAPRA